MATGAKKGYGAVFETSDGASPPVWTALSEVIFVGPLGQLRPKLNVTNMDSANESEEFISAMKTGQEITVRVNDTYHSSQVSLETRALAGSTVDCRIRYTQYSPIKTKTFSISFNGTVRPSLTPADANILEYQGQITGDIVTT